jgi:hypothetical protein
MRTHERIKEVEKDSWTCGGTKKRHGRDGVAAVDWRRDVRFRATAERRGMRGRRQRGGAEAVAKILGDAWSGAGAGAGLGRRGNGG